jgi:hypothetical protein
MILYVLLLSLYFYRVLQNSNSERHLDDSFFFAHFSKINNKNFFVYPELLLTSPKHIILNEGESLYIPPNWWHWIRSEKSIAINFWCLDECTIFNEPHILRDKFVNKDLIVDKISNYNNSVMVWNSSNDKTIPGTMNINRDNNYVITLPGYGNTKEKLNIPLLDHVKKDIVKPKYFKDKDVDINLWVAAGKHDTGLHYDDKAGILSVLKGKKYITLYPPHNSSYLHPYEVVPDWAKTKPYKVEYNVFHFDRELKNALPSSRLLYESLYGAKYRSDIVQKLSAFPDRSVWGCKKQGGHMRWEVYQYQYDIKDSSKMSPLLKDRGIVITSTDVYDTSNVIGDEDHIYTCDNGNMGFPFFGHGYKNEDEPESIFVLDNKQRFKKKFGDYMKKIGFDKNVDKFYSYQNQYNCKHICVHNKMNNQLFIQYLGITVEDFVWFLIKFGYDIHLIKHVITNMHMYRNINHEITIVYDIQTGEPIRSGFYGILMK